MIPPMHDAVIVGAGPAGSTLALLLARAGVDVALLDRAVFPRPKPCGDCLSAEATRLLDRLGLLPAVRALAPAELVGWRVFGPGGASVTAAFSDLGDPDPRVHQALAVPRREFDATLLAAAAAAGVQVTTGAHVTDLLRAAGQVTGVSARSADGTEREFRARITVGADGLRSRVASRLGAVRRLARVRKLSFTTHVPRAAGDRYGEMHVAAGLCAGLAPVSADGLWWNVTLVADSDRFGRQAIDAREFFTRALRLIPTLADEPIEPGELLASGPFDRPVSRVTFDGAALAGDAAGYFDPFTGQGIYHALAAAELLATTLSPALRTAARGIGRDALRPYAQAHAALTRGPRRVQRLIHHVLDRPALAHAALAGLARRPAAMARLLAVTGDLQPAASLLSPKLLLSLLFPGAARRATPTME